MSFPIIEATMYFRYGNNKRSEVTSETTFDAILKGERTSTTRFDIWMRTERWKDISVGSLIRFFEDKYKKGRYVDVVVDSVKRIDLGLFSEEELEEWSKAEGWSVKYAKSISNRGLAYQIRYHVPDDKFIIKSL